MRIRYGIGYSRFIRLIPQMEFKTYVTNDVLYDSVNIISGNSQSCERLRMFRRCYCYLQLANVLQKYSSVGFSYLVCRKLPTNKTVFTSQMQKWALPFIVLFSVLFLFYNYIYDPLIDFRPYKTGVNLPEQMTVDESKLSVMEHIFIY